MEGAKEAYLKARDAYVESVVELAQRVAVFEETEARLKRLDDDAWFGAYAALSMALYHLEKARDRRAVLVVDKKRGLC